MRFYESNYVTLHSDMNIMTENGANNVETAAILVLSSYYLAPVRKVLF